MRQLVYVYFFEGNCSGEISNFASSGRFFSNILAGMEDVLFWIVQNDNLTMFLRCMAHRYHPHPDCASLVGRYDLALGAFLRRILFFAHNDSDELIATKIHLRNSHFVKKTYIYTYIFFCLFFFHRWQLLQISDVATTTSHNATDVTVIHVHLFRLTSQAFCKCWYMKRWNKA